MCRKGVTEHAPACFGKVFDFILNDLANISSYAKDVTKCKEECHRQTLEINCLRQKVCDLEKKTEHWRIKCLKWKTTAGKIT